MSVLDRLPDFGERYANGQTVDEFLDVLVRMPVAADEPDVTMLAAAICHHRLTGNGLGGIRDALAGWRPFPAVRH